MSALDVVLDASTVANLTVALLFFRATRWNGRLVDAIKARDWSRYDALKAHPPLVERAWHVIERARAARRAR